MNQEIVKRFWEKVDKSGNCWEWTAYKNSDGYGNFKVFKKMLKAHRVSYELTTGFIPDGFCVCHHCDNPGCVNPDHLFLATHAENMSDMVKKGRASRKPPAFGEKQHLAKLTDEHVRRIKDMLTVGAKQQDIAKWFGVSGATISMVKSRKVWAHV